MAAVLSLAHATLRLLVLTTLLECLGMPVPSAVMLGIMKVCSMPSQRCILVRLTLVSCSLVTTAMWELSPVFVLWTLRQGAGPTAPWPPLYPCAAMSQTQCDITMTWPVLTLLPTLTQQ